MDKVETYWAVGKEKDNKIIFIDLDIDEWHVDPLNASHLLGDIDQALTEIENSGYKDLSLIELKMKYRLLSDHELVEKHTLHLKKRDSLETIAKISRNLPLEKLERLLQLAEELDDN
jgi:hypothetical protein